MNNKKWAAIGLVIVLILLVGFGGKIYMSKQEDKKEAEKIETERMSVVALKQTFANIKVIEIKKSEFDTMTGAFDVSVQMTNQENESVDFTYTYWKEEEELGSIGIENTDVQVDGVTESSVRVIYSNKEEGDI